MDKYGIAFFLAAFLSITPVVALGKCGAVPASYDDVDAVILTNNYRMSDGYHDEQTARTLADSSFWAFFWSHGPSEYSQYTLRNSIGMFRLHVSLAYVRRILEHDRFFSITPHISKGTDVTESVLSVRHCAVVTRIVAYKNPQHADAASARVFSDLVALVDGSKKLLTDAKPESFELTLLFNP